jgi:predicted O-methyltransferase YrrM
MDAFAVVRDVVLLTGTILLLSMAVGGALYGLRKMRHLFSRLTAIEASVASLRKAVASIATEAGEQAGRPSRLFQQLEALIAVYVDLRPNRSLPPTRAWAASPDLLRLIAAHVLEAKPEIVVECGSGVSTVVLARCLALNGSGHVYSLENVPEYAKVTRMELARHDLSERATVLDAPLREHVLPSGRWLWYPVEGLPEEPFDMLVVDGPPDSTGPLARYPAGPLLFGRLAKEGVIVLDDAARRAERAALDRWTAEDPGLMQEISDCEKGCVILRRRA